MASEKKEYAKKVIIDLVADFLYYDRKEDEDLNRDDILKLYQTDELTVQETIQLFAEELARAIGD